MLFLPSARVREGEKAPCRVAAGSSGGVEQRFHFLAAGNVSVPDPLIVRAQNARGALDLRRLALDLEVVIEQVRFNAQRGFQEFQVFIEGAEEFVDPSGDTYGLFHQVSWSLG